MECKKMKDTIYLRVDKGESVTETIKEVRRNLWRGLSRNRSL